ncbi:hypothetical protein DYB32_009956 [Aphanomyces invadans]|uniref:Uncharacterized protein n=1 Tax=Aphanomyces invadans TaxID=157072 RepID=A0A418AH36_9STRA|nr:hypothetical protein DYB32_009956 [Aphanomyces invadans]
MKDGPRPDTSRTDREPGAQPRLVNQPEGMITHGVAVTLATTQEDQKEEYMTHGVVVSLAATQADKTEDGGTHQDGIDHSSRERASLQGACWPSAAPPPSDVASDKTALSPALTTTHPVEVPRTPRSRKAKQDDNFNSRPPVFTPGQVESIIRGDLAGLPDTRMVDIEDRLYPVTAEDLNMQLQALKTRHRDVSHEEIAQVVMKALNRPLTADDKMLLEAPANIDDPERWLAWFTRALKTCEEARTANRNVESNRGGIVATTRWARMERKGLGSTNLPHFGPVPESVCADLFGHLDGELAHHPVPEGGHRVGEPSIGLEGILLRHVEPDAKFVALLTQSQVQVAEGADHLSGLVQGLLLVLRPGPERVKPRLHGGPTSFGRRPGCRQLAF